MSVVFGGKTISKPGAYSIITREDTTPSSFGSAQVLAFIAGPDDVSAESLAVKDKVLWFNNFTDAKASLKSGNLLNYMSIAWSPTKDQGALGADLIAIVICTAATSANFTTALTLLRKENIQGIIPITTLKSIQALVKDHVVDMSGVKLRKERRAFFGTDKLSTIASAAGLGATATAIVSEGVVTGVQVTDGGAGYLVPPTVVVDGVGTGAEFVAVVDGGKVVSITVSAGGTGYTVAPTLSFTYSDPRLADERIIDEVEAHVLAAGTERTSILVGGIKKYVDGQLLSTDGVGFAAAVAGMWAGKKTPIDPVTFDELDIVGLEYEVEDVEPLLEAGGIPAEVTYGENRKPKYRVVDAITANGGDLAVETTIDEMNKILRREMEDEFVGKVTGDPKSVSTSKFNKFISLLNTFVRQGWLVESTDENSGDVIPAYKDVVMIKEGKSTRFTWWGKVAEPDNYILIDSHIAVSSN